MRSSGNEMSIWSSFRESSTNLEKPGEAEVGEEQGLSTGCQIFHLDDYQLREHQYTHVVLTCRYYYFLNFNKIKAE